MKTPPSNKSGAARSGRRRALRLGPRLAREARRSRSVCLVLAAAALLGWTSRLQAEAPRSAAINYKVIPNLEEVKDHPSAPDFTLVGPDNKKISLKDFRGKLVFLNFWASWCAPCREEMPAMERLYQEFKNKGFTILAVSVKDSRKDAIAFVKELKLTYPIALDPEGEVGLLYGAWGLPATYLIDANGIVLARAWGPANWYSPPARQLIASLLNAKK
ncbi:MAG TPA: TlpA disulfide reductase family protein [Candidatus Acidoferrales bacterium]|nr:TlpA disulfide reductase family protein [Candidatus Acidoferrales bacterium]